MIIDKLKKQQEKNERINFEVLYLCITKRIMTGMKYIENSSHIPDS